MRKLRPILLASFFFSLHLALVAYINSSMLGGFLTPKGIGIIFTLSSALSLFFVAKAARYVEKWGVVRYMATVLGLSAGFLLLLGLTNGHWVSVLLFIPYFALNALIYYGFDVFLEHFASPKTMGNTRGLYLTLNNIAWVGMPAFVGFLQGRYGMGIVYFFAAFAILAGLLTLFLGEKHYHDGKYVHVSLKSMFSVLRKKSDVRGSVVINALLNLFYVWMVIYVPLYLIETLGYAWSTVGLILSTMLVPFILFQYPMGRIADKYSNERELIASGLLIMGVATLIFSLVSGESPVALALILFLTRVGASIVEVSNESYFFKHVTEHDTPTIAVFRNMTPLAYLVGPIIAIILLGWSMYAVLFFLLGLIMIAGAIFALSLHDIKKE